MAKKWTVEETAVKPPIVQQEHQVEAPQQSHNRISLRQKSLYSPASPDPPRSLWIPEIFVTSKTGQSFRCSFSAVGTFALQRESQLLDQTRELWMPLEPSHTRPCEARLSRTRWTPREANLCQAMFNLRLGTQQTNEELRAIRADLESIRAGFQEHERDIAMLQTRQLESGVRKENYAEEEMEQPVITVDLRHEKEYGKDVRMLQEQECQLESEIPKESLVEKTETETTELVDEIAWLMEAESEEKEAENLSRSRRRGRIFPCTSPKAVLLPALHLVSHQCSKIPVRASPKPNPSLDTTTISCSDSLKLDTEGNWSHLPILAEEPVCYDKVLQERRRRTSDGNRDSGYASPSSTYGSTSTDTVLDECVRLDVVRESVEG